MYHISSQTFVFLNRVCLQLEKMTSVSMEQSVHASLQPQLSHPTDDGGPCQEGLWPGLSS